MHLCWLWLLLAMYGLLDVWTGVCVGPMDERTRDRSSLQIMNAAFIPKLFPCAQQTASKMNCDTGIHARS